MKYKVIEFIPINPGSTHKHIIIIEFYRSKFMKFFGMKNRINKYIGDCTVWYLIDKNSNLVRCTTNMEYFLANELKTLLYNKEEWERKK